MAPPRTEDSYEDEGEDFEDQGSECSASDNDDDDVVIAIMGSTGSGKSSFIKLLSGNDSVKTGDSLESETIDVRCVDFVDEETGRKVILVDTPGFDDSRDGVTDTDILKKITGFLLEEYDNKRKLNGIIYIHSIASTRFSGQSVRNLKMFKNLCGAETYKNVVILTTFWDDRSAKKMGEKREAELKSKFCLQLAQGGAAFMRHNRTKSSSHKVLDYIFTLVPTDVQITKEIRVDGKTLEDTAAGSVHRAEVDALIAKHKAEVEELMNEMKDMKGANEEMRKELAKEKEEMRMKLDRLEQERVALSDGLAGEQKARQALEDKLQQDKEERIQQDKDWSKRYNDQSEKHTDALKRMEKEFKDSSARRQEQDSQRLLAIERQARQDAEDKLRKAQGRGWGQLGLELAEDIPLVPNFLAKPVLGSLGFGVDLLSGGSRKRRARS
ncbi:hypothetical protein D9757_011613 [Collybiopsis confluens]|uniref:G domain-containing protein n=1 Tax=Collybiopsis confluens TaxID=2823264 RepID=A0A8H5LWY1_9AGAR|nr:hypothetical protein D9757_011613 [Collybiopsis confluens]